MPIAAMLPAVPTLTASQKLHALEGLSVTRLRALTDQLDLRPRDRRAKESLVEALASDFARVIGELMREELREMCEALALDASGKTEKELARRIRTRLIADVVTGKLDVREAASRLPDQRDAPDPLDEADPLADAGDADRDATPDEADA